MSNASPSKEQAAEFSIASIRELAGLRRLYHPSIQTSRPKLLPQLKTRRPEIQPLPAAAAAAAASSSKPPALFLRRASNRLIRFMGARSRRSHGPREYKFACAACERHNF